MRGPSCIDYSAALTLDTGFWLAVTGLVLAGAAIPLLWRAGMRTTWQR
jgi:hypothetical protein